MGKAERLNSDLENTLQLNSSGRTTLISGAVYHNFEENPLFTGKYKGECWGKGDNGESKCIGFYFVNGDYEEVLITNAFAIEKALNTVTSKGLVKDMDCVLEIEFQGKTIIKKTGKPFNRFQVTLLS
jgi:hypothetical protein